MTDLARQIIASQSHRRFIDPRFLAKRVEEFVIVRPQPAPVAETRSAQHAVASGASDGTEVGL